MTLSRIEGDWLVPNEVTKHQMSKWQGHARERLDLAKRYWHHNNIAVQAGGNLGIWPVLLVKEYGFKQVFSFEPDPENIVYLRANTEDLPVVRYEAALGRSAGTARWLKDTKGRPGWHKVMPKDEQLRDELNEQTVGVLAIDEIPILADYDRVDLIALDIEGFELEALMGAEKTLYKDRPVVIIEDLHRSKFKSFRQLGGMAYGHPVGKLQDWLRERGYRKAEAIKNDEIWVHE